MTSRTPEMPPPPYGAAPGRITPAPGPAWDITVTTRAQARAIAAAYPAAVTRAAPRQWTARIPRLRLAVTATAADAGTLTVTLDDAPAAGPLTLAFEPWTAADIMPPGPPRLPAAGHLAMRDIRLHTLMGRTVRYLIPAFTAR